MIRDSQSDGGCDDGTREVASAGRLRRRGGPDHLGIATIAIGIAGKNTVEDELSQEKIVGSPDMSPEGIAPGIEEAKLTVDAPDCDVAEEPITTGAEARCFAQYMRIHALESSAGLTYAEMGRFVSEVRSERPCRHQRRGSRFEG